MGKEEGRLMGPKEGLGHEKRGKRYDVQGWEDFTNKGK